MYLKWSQMSGQGFYGGVIVHRACGHKLYMKRVN